MRKSKEVPLTILAALSVALTSCHSTPETRNCVDAQGRVVPDSKCDDYSSTSPYHYIYNGSSGGHVGDTVFGGSRYSSGSSESGVSRGGFGHAGGGEGGGE